MNEFVYDALAGRVVFGDGAVGAVPREADRLAADAHADLIVTIA
jgi:hypothetical protein